VKGYSEDYSFLIQALIDLYEISFDTVWLKRAVDLNQEMIRQFWTKAREDSSSLEKRTSR